MAEKGGKGFSPSIGGKSSLTSLGDTYRRMVEVLSNVEPSVKSKRFWKDDTSAKKKRERKAKFDYEDPVEGTRSNGVAHEPISKGDGGKGRKGGKPANSSKAKESSLELPIETELPENTKCLMDCEAAEILQGIQDHMVVLSSDPAIKIPISFDKGLKYAKRGSVYPNPKAARQILEPLKKFGISDAEMCMISNIQVESVDEVFALVPSLEGKKLRLTEPLKDMLDELAKVKSSA